MSFENGPQAPQEQLLTEEQFAAGVQTIYDVAHSALAANQTPESHSGSLTKRAMTAALEGVLAGNHGHEAQLALWEASSALARTNYATQTVDGINNQIVSTLDVVREHGDGNGSRIDYLHGRIYGKDGLHDVNSELAYTADNLAKIGDNPNKHTYWANQARTVGFQTTERLQDYYVDAHREVEKAYSTIRYGSDKSITYIRDLNQYAESQESVGKDLRQGNSPDRDALLNGAYLHQFTDVIKEALAETDAAGLTERLKVIIEKSPNMDAIINVGEAVLNGSVDAKKVAERIFMDYGDNMNSAVSLVKTDIETQFDAAAAGSIGGQVSLDSDMHILAGTPANYLKQLNLAAEAWASHVALSLQPISPKPNLRLVR